MDPALVPVVLFFALINGTLFGVTAGLVRNASRLRFALLAAGLWFCIFVLGLVANTWLLPQEPEVWRVLGSCLIASATMVLLGGLVVAMWKGKR